MTIETNKVKVVDSQLHVPVLVQLLQIAAETLLQDKGAPLAVVSVSDVFLLQLAELIVANNEAQLRKWALHEIFSAVLQNFSMTEERKVP
jgi:hypothetical protein